MRAESRPEQASREPDYEVQAAVDEIDGCPHVVIADITCDDAWIAMADDDAATLSERR
jgi:hypothetical protein